MGFIQGEGRTQGTLFPVTLDELIPQDHVCRVIDAFVDRLDMAGLGFERAEPGDTGARLVLATAPRCCRTFSALDCYAAEFLRVPPHSFLCHLQFLSLHSVPFPSVSFLGFSPAHFRVGVRYADKRNNSRSSVRAVDGRPSLPGFRFAVTGHSNLAAGLIFCLSR